MRFRYLLPTCIFLKIALGACGGGGGSKETAIVPAPIATATSTPTPAPTPTTSSPLGTVLPSDIPDYAKTARLDAVDYTAFNDFVGWIECITTSATQNITNATCEFEEVRLVERNRATSAETVVAKTRFTLDEGQPIRCDFDGTGAQVGPCRGANYRRYENGRIAWYERQDEAGGKLRIDNSAIRAGVLVVDAAARRDRVAHAWTQTGTTTERAPWKSGHDYFVEGRIRVTGAAAARFGADGWRSNANSISCPPNQEYGCRNIQLYQGDWYGQTGGQLVTLRVKVTQ